MLPVYCSTDEVNIKSIGSLRLILFRTYFLQFWIADIITVTPLSMHEWIIRRLSLVNLKFLQLVGLDSEIYVSGVLHDPTEDV